ncbi:MAG: UbiA family prenyltransferase [Cyanobacteria bacterium]|nr:UbiA family prenyltransferase [Cyanobacteriota bacterium]
MTLALVWGNTVVVASHSPNDLPSSRIAIVTLVTFFIFFRLRIFDDIKDYETDCRIKPSRPLARKLISLLEAKMVAFALAFAEGLLALYLGTNAFCAWGLLFVYSVLMYREFFVGRWLRPQMEFYALTHTWVAVWIGLFIATALSDTALNMLPIECVVFSGCNWLVFNVFEFARKTFGSDEETLPEDPCHEETYSQRLTPIGAGLLTLFNALLAIAGLYWLQPNNLFYIPAVLGVACLALCLIYMGQPHCPQSRWFRNGMGLFIVLYYLVSGLCLAR